MSDDKPPLGFIGTGLMGLPMCLRLLAAGFEVTVWNRTAARSEPAVTGGAVPAASPAAVAAASEIVLVCVSDTRAVEAVVLGPDGVATADGAGKVLVDHSSIRPDATRAIAARLEAANGMRWIDAPVSGGVRGAEDGTLTIMAGGREADFARVAPVLAVTSQRASLMGEVGAGQTTKLCNQMIVGCTMAAIAEALRFATSSGIDAGRLFEALKGGFADSLPLQIFGPRMLSHIEQPIGHIETVLKDVETALQHGYDIGATMPMTATAGQLYRLLVAQGHGRAEFDALYRLYGPATPEPGEPGS